MRIHLLNESLAFPPADFAIQDGLLALGGDLSYPRLINAYAHGIFPWYEDGQPIMWWSPNPRMVLYPKQLKISKSMRKIIKEEQFEVRFDHNFDAVISACAATKRKGQDGTWITDELTNAFIGLHKLGLAHSVETYQNGLLVGGLYGLSLGTVFFGESMFHHVSNASKIAFFYLTDFLIRNQFQLIDAQQDTAHLRSLGAITIDRRKFLSLLADYIHEPSLVGNWGENDRKRKPNFVVHYLRQNGYNIENESFH